MNESKYKRLLYVFFSLLTFLTIVYSYTQVDLNLTLSTNAYYQIAQEKLQYVGYFQRTWSAIFYCVLMVLWFFLQYIVFSVWKKGKISRSTIVKLLIITGCLVFSYPAFSYDVFNYMFDARIVTNYGLDPHFFKALDFPNDTWTRFMRWTHRYYPYGPIWLYLTLIPSYIGVQKFVLTLFLYKMMFAGFHFFNVWLIGKITSLRSSKDSIVAMLMYGLNPLVITESLISPHNEVMMWTGVLVSIYFLMRKELFFSVTMLLLSVGIKFLSLILIPLITFVPPASEKFYKIGFWLWTISLIPLILSREFYPWYFVPILGWIAFLPVNSFYTIVGSGLSLGLLFRYVPFLLYGSYGDSANILTQWWILVFFMGVSIYCFLWRRNDRQGAIK